MREPGEENRPYDLEGWLGAFTLSDLLQMLAYTHKTGTLTLIQGWNTRTITFERGRITYVAAGSRLPTLSELLVRAGALRAEEVEQLAAEEPDEERLLERLLTEGRIALDDLERCREQQLEVAIYTLFLWRNCRFTFRAGECRYEDGIPISVDSMQVILEGTRRVDEWIQFSPVIPSVSVIFRKRGPLQPVPAELVGIYQLVDGHRDVATLAREAGLTQFETARALFRLYQMGLVEAIPPNRAKIIELFTLAVESIYLKLVLYDYPRIALEFEQQLNQFARQHGLRVRMAAGRVIKTDRETRLSSTELIDLYKLFIAIQNNKFQKLFEPTIARGLMEGLYRHADPEMQQMLRMYEFYEIEGLFPRRREYRATRSQA
ncbi:DUF4388 domain-containing protein [Thermomicrobium sp. 4228-Ro]|uniref:DUF4388 domain-containing protein n=1 Tax=Thermomicrobium sp. 4228-Ro TaxID=2993937 RepID=UPI00224893D8|nr:DUF4388 domain-containing protein [Thermomicrobium sp. 4228-Ro]MCX2727835.1 DUF4388 domain-containing protein [Thermomicrobium sp. 4228-Ro]